MCAPGVDECKDYHVFEALLKQMMTLLKGIFQFEYGEIYARHLTLPMPHTHICVIKTWTHKG